MGWKRNRLMKKQIYSGIFELGHHFECPIRTYSSGMKGQTSVATAFKPDILLIVEALGVGDASFRKR